MKNNQHDQAEEEVSPLLSVNADKDHVDLNDLDTADKAAKVAAVEEVKAEESVVAYSSPAEKQAVSVEKPSVGEQNHLSEKNAVKKSSVLYLASSNSLVFSVTMLVSLLLFGMIVLFVVPTQWLEERQWQVMPALHSLFYMFGISIIFYPVSLLFQLMIAGMVQEFKKYTWQMEFAGLSFALILGVCFFWPGYLL